MTTSSFGERVSFLGIVLFGIGIGVLMVGLRKVLETPSGFYSSDILRNYLLTFLVGAIAGWLLALGQLGIRQNSLSVKGYTNAIISLGTLALIIGFILTIIQLRR